MIYSDFVTGGHDNSMSVESNPGANFNLNTLNFGNFHSGRNDNGPTSPYNVSTMRR